MERVLDRRSGVALWRQIEEILEDDIGSGRAQPGARLGTEQALSERFAVNRHTVRQAIANLELRGLVRVERGSGTYVREPVLDYTIGLRTRFSEVLARHSRRASGRLLENKELPAQSDTARALDIKVGEPVLMLKILRFSDDRPVGLGAHHFPLPRFRGLDQAFRQTGSITGALRRWGVTDYLRARTRISAALPDKDEARLLAQPADRPVLVTDSINIDRDGQPIEHGLTRLASDWVHLVIEG